MIDVKTGKDLSRRDFGKGIAAILAAGCAPTIVSGAMMRMTGARNATVFGGGWSPDPTAYLSNENTQIHSGPYIDLDYTHTVNTNVEIDFMRYGQDGSSGNGGYCALFGSRYSDNQRLNSFYLMPSIIDSSSLSSVLVARSSNGEVRISNNFSIGSRAVFSTNGLLMIFNGSQVTLTGSISSGFARMILFSLNKSTNGGILTDTSGWGGFAKFRIWNFKIKEGNTIVSNMYPREINGECGMWDIVRNRFFGDVSGSGIPLLIGHS